MPTVLTLHFPNGSEDMETASSVSLIIPTLNRRGLLMQTLDSLCDQTYPHWEAVVVDDGSTDGTDVMMERFCRWEPRIRYMHRQGDLAGANVCRNQGVEAATGEYVIFLDSDDLLAPHCLEGRVKVMEESPDLDFAVFMGELFAETPGDVGRYHNVFTDEDDLDRFSRADNPWSTTGPIWQRASLVATGGFDTGLQIAQEWELYIRCLLRSPCYSKHAAADYHVRLPSASRPSIGGSWRTPDNCFAKGEVRVKAAQMIRESGQLTEIRRTSLAGYASRMAQELAEMGATDRAAELLELMRAAGLISSRCYAGMRVLMPCVGRRSPAASVCRAFLRLWRHRYSLRLVESKTFMRAPVVR